MQPVINFLCDDFAFVHDFLVFAYHHVFHFGALGFPCSFHGVLVRHKVWLEGSGKNEACHFFQLAAPFRFGKRCLCLFTTFGKHVRRHTGAVDLVHCGNAIFREQQPLCPSHAFICRKLSSAEHNGQLHGSLLHAFIIAFAIGKGGKYAVQFLKHLVDQCAAVFLRDKVVFVYWAYTVRRRIFQPVCNNLVHSVPCGNIPLFCHCADLNGFLLLHIGACPNAECRYKESNYQQCPVSRPPFSGVFCLSCHRARPAFLFPACPFSLLFHRQV